MGVRLPAVLVVLGALLSAPSALAQPTSSSNWAGYAIHRPGTRFQLVEGAWREPSATCRPGRATYSSMWVGLGGYRGGSSALEQIGTELDCTRTGQPRYAAWYELVPKPSVPIPLAVHPGDVIGAAVAVRGHVVSLTLEDFTTRHLFTKSKRVRIVDVSSAEWILEAPSACLGVNACFTLPLANFGSATFAAAAAETARGHRGAISDPVWNKTAIVLRPSGRTGSGGSRAALGSAFPGTLGSGGSSFSVTYSTVSVAERPLVRFP